MKKTIIPCLFIILLLGVLVSVGWKNEFNMPSEGAWVSFGNNAVVLDSESNAQSQSDFLAPFDDTILDSPLALRAYLVLHDANHKIHFNIPLLNAVCYRGNLECVEVLVDAGADIDYSDEYTSSPLLIAFARRDIKLISLLLERGANPNEISGPAKTLRGQAIDLPYPESVHLITTQGFKD